MARAPSNGPKRRQVKSDPPPMTSDPIEIAMEAEASGTAPQGVAHRLLEKQERLVGWQIASVQVGFALRCLAGGAALAVAVGLGVMALRASHSSELVVHTLSVPPALAEAGVTGAAVAATVMNRTGELERVADDIYSTPVTEGWAERSRIEIPQTGLSIDEVDRLLRRWLGDVVDVTGDVRQIKGGVRVTLHARGESVSAAGSLDQIDQVAADATDALHARVRPITHALRDLNRPDADVESALQLLRPVLQAGSTSRLDWYRATAVAAEAARRQRRLDEAERLFVMVGREAPDIRLRQAGYLNAFHIERMRGHPDRAVQHLRDALRNAKGMTPENRLAWRATRARWEGDQLEAARLTSQTDVGIAQQPFAIVYAQLHEIERARWVSGETGPITQVCLAAEDWPCLLARLEAGGQETVTDSPDFNPYWALALAKLGRTAEAKTYADQTPLDCYRCLLSRAQVAEAMGERASADRWFAEAIRQNPEFAQANLDWGRVQLARGQRAAGEANLRKASALWPRWSDPLSYWGESLLAQGDAAGAEAKFAAAAKLAPRWGRLHLKWGEALAKLGRADEARAKWRAAASMDLSVADRAALKGHGV